MFLVFINICLASAINLDLDKTEYGPESLFSGNLTLNLTGLPVDTLLVISVNDEGVAKELADTCYSYTETPATYAIASSASNPTITFSEAGSNLDYGFDINTYSSTIPSSVDADGYLKLTGVSPYAESPSLDINDDGIIDWEYVGPLKMTGTQINYLPISTNYLFNLERENVDKKIYGYSKDEFCENITLPLSQSYKINVSIKKINSGDLRVRIRDSNRAVVRNASNSEAECLISNDGSTDAYSWVSCEINNTNFIKKQNQNYLVCVYAKGGQSSYPYYYIAFQGPSAINRGYYCNSGSCSYANDIDYFIRAYYGDYEKQFSPSVTLTDVIKSSITKCSNNVKVNNQVHCIYPLKFMSKSAGSLQIEDVSLSYSGTDYPDPISKINYVPSKMSCDGIDNYYLDEEYEQMDFSDVLTPTEEGDYTVYFDLISGEDIIESASADFSVIPAPSIIFGTIPSQTSVGIPVLFNVSVSGNGPFNYSWDFGDSNKSKDRVITHTYKNIGEYNVSLTVTDVNGISSVEEFSIQVLSVKETLSSMLNSTRDALTAFSSKLKSTASISGLSDAMNFEKLVSDLSFNLSKYEGEFKTTQQAVKADNIKEQEYSTILQKLLSQRNSIPSGLNVNSITFDSKLNSYYEIPDEVTTDKEDIFSLQDKINIVSNAYSVSIDYLSGNSEDYTLVKKTVSVSGDTKDLFIIEYIPKTVANNIEEENILTPGFNIVSKDPIIKWSAGSLDIMYKLDYGSLDSIIDTRTFLYTGEIVAKSFENEPTCGDNVCNPLEEGWCPDCIPKYPYGFLVFLFILVIAGVYYINFYHGKYNFKELSNLISVKLFKKRLFTNDQDLVNLENYVKVALNKMDVNQIKFILTKKGWNNKQIDYVLTKVNKRKV